MDDDEEHSAESKDEEAEQEDEKNKGKGKEVEGAELVQTPSLEAELECARARSVMNANIAACYVKLVSAPPYVCAPMTTYNECRRNGRKLCLHAPKVNHTA